MAAGDGWRVVPDRDRWLVFAACSCILSVAAAAALWIDGAWGFGTLAYVTTNVWPILAGEIVVVAAVVFWRPGARQAARL